MWRECTAVMDQVLSTCTGVPNFRCEDLTRYFLEIHNLSWRQWNHAHTPGGTSQPKLLVLQLFRYINHMSIYILLLMVVGCFSLFLCLTLALCISVSLSLFVFLYVAVCVCLSRCLCLSVCLCVCVCVCLSLSLSLSLSLHTNTGFVYPFPFPTSPMVAITIYKRMEPLWFFWRQYNCQ